MPLNERPYDFLYIINKFGHICKGFQVTALWNMPDLDLTSPGQSRSKLIAPNESAYMTSYTSSLINLAVSARVTKLQPSEICITSIWPLQVTPGQRQLRQMKPHMTSYPSSIVTLWLSWIDLEIQAIKNLCDLDWPFNVKHLFSEPLNLSRFVIYL